MEYDAREPALVVAATEITPLQFAGEELVTFWFSLPAATTNTEPIERAVTVQKKLPPNVDWPSARLYHYLGLRIEVLLHAPREGSQYVLSAWHAPLRWLEQRTRDELLHPLRPPSLLAVEPCPSEETVRHYLRGNICRCTGYVKIIEAILDLAHNPDRYQSE